MTDSLFPGPTAGAADDLASDVDPRFDSAAAGIDPPRPENGTRSAQEQWDDIAESCRSWVRGKPLQAMGIVAAVGFLLGRSRR